VSTHLKSKARFSIFCILSWIVGKLDGDLIQFLCELALRNMDDIDELVFHAALKAILCVNLQFSSFEENPLLQVISNGQSPLSLLGNAIIAILNRGENTSDVEICLKFLKDLYSSLSTSDFFFINDFKVLIDIIIRQLIDLDQEDKVCINSTSNGDKR